MTSLTCITLLLLNHSIEDSQLLLQRNKNDTEEKTTDKIKRN